MSPQGYFLYVDGQHINKEGMIDKDQPSKPTWNSIPASFLTMVETIGSKMRF